MGVPPFIADAAGAPALRESDVRVDTHRASGAGGQHVNTTSSAVRVVHIPTGITVVCQAERSQHSNKAAALDLLRAKLAQREQESRALSVREFASQLGDNSWGNQIRSYVQHPYKARAAPLPPPSMTVRLT